MSNLDPYHVSPDTSKTFYVAGYVAGYSEVIPRGALLISKDRGAQS